ncbi:hypothetical protein EDD11_005905 [Mortierella claussenii]|nr:hypothetical protein EDD11_005905 [Mortierella claussenii]
MSTPAVDTVKPSIIIVGAGLAGLMMALLLERIDIPYQILERALKVKPLGSALSLTANILPALEQVGLLEDIYRIGKPCKEMKLFGANMQPLGAIVMDGSKIAGYHPIVMVRHMLYDLMLSKIPAHKVLMGKKVIMCEQDDKGVTVSCADGSIYRGDILVGADGAYSTIRSNLYRDLNEKQLLPESDLNSLSRGYISLVGVTDPLDPERYPELKDPFNHSSLVVGGDGLSLGVASEEHTQDSQNAEWTPELKNESTIKLFHDKLNPFGGTMGDLIDATPKENISRVYLEEKFFETWHFKRVVLIGDACHKLLPASGQGAVNAMQDAVVLVNALYDLQSLSMDSIEDALESYKRQRYPQAKFQFNNSLLASSLLLGQTWTQRLFRTMYFNYMPKWIFMRQVTNAAAYRPQAAFLPLIEPRGTGHMLPQHPSRRRQQEEALKRTSTFVVV